MSVTTDAFLRANSGKSSAAIARLKIAAMTGSSLARTQ